MGNDFGRAIGKQIATVTAAAQRDLDSLLDRAPGAGELSVRTEVAALFERHGFDAPAEDVDRCTRALVAGERVILDLSY
jgi:hypothetical protein